MSEVAIRDVCKIPDSEMVKGNCNNGHCLKSLAESVDANTKIEQKNGRASFNGVLKDGAPIKTDGIDSGQVLASSEVEYIESGDLRDVEDVENCLKSLLSELNSKDWVSVCDALNNLRRFCLFHKEDIVSILNDVISMVVKSLKNPRSAVCKTAIMTSVDIFKVYKDGIIDSLDPLLVQLLLKASQDKKFVCEAAEGALIALTSSVSPLLLLPKLQPYVKNRNPRIRAKASMCISRSVPRLGADGIDSFGIDKLIQIGASQLSDQLPESRDAARALLVDLQSLYEKSPPPEPNAISEEHVVISWENLCQSKLSPLSAQAVLRVTNIAREGLVLGS